VKFWASSENDVDYTPFQGMVDFSRYSVHVANGQPSCYGSPLPATCVPQLITHWDDSGPPSSPLNSTVSPQVNCTYPGNSKWITWGDDVQSGNVAGDDSQCSIPNWAAKPFGNDPANASTGQLRVDTARGASVDLGSVRTTVCSTANKPPAPLVSPSCADPTVGDWVETNNANTANKLSDSLLRYIAANPKTDQFADVLCTSCPGGTTPYGRYVVMNVYLWDCADTYDPTLKTWTLVEPKAGGPGPKDCSDIHKKANISPQTIDRVHLFTIAPFRFYEGLVQSSSISGFWGGLVSGDAGCPTCVLNQFSNAVVLVGD
jgi:hypothetical protein